VSIPCKAGKGYVHFTSEQSEKCLICNIASDPILDAMRKQIREKSRAKRLQKLEGAANAWHHAKHTGKGVADAKALLLNAAWDYGDSPNTLAPRHNK
jgi:hypothetical protein